MEKDRSIAERRDVIIRKVLEDMFALQRKQLGIVGAKLVACVARPPNESGRRHPQPLAHHARSPIGSAAPPSEIEMKGIVTPARKYHDIRTTQMSEEVTMANRTKGPRLGVLLVALGLSTASVGLTASPAQAEHGHVSIGIGIPLAPAVPPPVVYAPPAYVAPPPVVYAPPAYVAPPLVVAYPAPVYGGVSLGFGWHDGGRHHWRR
jgi:hypothetical protein